MAVLVTALAFAGCDLDRPLTKFGDTPSGLLAVGDLNGDGHPDIVSAATRSDQMTGYTVLIGDGQGGFTPTVVDDGTSAASLDLADVDGDGDLDMVVAVVYGRVNLRLNDGGGRFGEPQLLPPTWDDCRAGCFNLRHATVGDVNGDGRVDLVETGDHPGYVWVRLGDGSAGFGTAVFYRPRPWYFDQVGNQISLADMDGDGDLDVIIVGSWRDNYSGVTRGNLAIGRNDGTGAFPTFNAYDFGGETTSPGATLSAPIDIADVDEDGNLDVILDYYDPDDDASGVSIHISFGDGAGGLARKAAPTDQIGGRDDAWHVLADLTGDGHLDLVVPPAYYANVRRAELFVADAPGSFVYDRTLATDGHISDALAADLDADGRHDLVFASARQNYVQIDLNGLGDG
jgi:hypothetical protein